MRSLCVVGVLALLTSTTWAQPQPLPRGPLSRYERVPERTWPEVQAARAVLRVKPLDAAQMAADMAALAPISAGNLRLAQTATLLVKLAGLKGGYSVNSMTSSLVGDSEWQGHCGREPGVPRHCFHQGQIAPPRSAPSRPYTLTRLPHDIVRLSIFDLSTESFERWATFATDLAMLKTAKGIVIDMVDARGNDPRPLVPWLERLTGQSPLRPLRAIRRVVGADAAVASYRRQYRDETRVAAVWDALVGKRVDVAARVTSPPPPPPPPIEIAVGPGCEAACELVARVLETYAGAVVVGGVLPAARLYRDDAAHVQLPHSQIDVYFFANEYLLDDAIEQRTGPTAAWRSHVEPASQDVIPFALAQLERRIANGGTWPARCDSLPAYTSAAELPATARAKLDGGAHACSGDFLSIGITSPLPLSALRALIATCAATPLPIATRLGERLYYLGVGERATFPWDWVSRLLQSDAIDSLHAECKQPPRLQ